MLLASATVGCRQSARGVAPVLAQPPEPAPTPVADEPAPVATDDDRYASLAGFCDGVPPVDRAEHDARVTSIAAAAKAAGLDAVVMEPGPNMQYVAGVRWGLSERPFLCVVRASGEVAWVSPAFEARSAAERLPEDAAVSLWQEHESPYAAVASIVGTKAAVAVDPGARGFIHAGLQAAIRGARIEGGPLESVRLRKTGREVDRLRRANEATKAAIAAAAEHLRPGMTQSAFAAELTAAQRAAGLGQVWCLALFGPAASFPHGTAEDRTLREDDVVLVDTGGSLHGYRSDVSRTWTVGTPAPAVADAWAAVALAQATALAEIRPGARCGRPDAAARGVLEAAGFGAGYERFTHRLGHGIGLQVHEPPYLRPENPRVLAPGMAMSNEPGIYQPGRFGIRIEDIVVVSESGAEVLGVPVGPYEDPLRGHARTA